MVALLKFLLRHAVGVLIALLAVAALIVAVVATAVIQTQLTVDKWKDYNVSGMSLPAKATGTYVKNEENGSVELSLSGDGLFAQGIKGTLVGTKKETEKTVTKTRRKYNPAAGRWETETYTETAKETVYEDPWAFTDAQGSGAWMAMRLPENPYALLGFFDYLPQETQENWERAVDVSSEKYRINQTASTDADGFRRVGDKYLVALGGYYGTEIGGEYEIAFEGGQAIGAVLGGNIEGADANGQFRLFSGSVLTFFMATRSPTHETMIREKFGRIAGIKRVNLSVSLSGSITGETAAGSGMIGGSVPISFSGEAKGGRIKAAGVYGAGASAALEGSGPLVFPVPMGFVASSEFGMRVNPVTKKYALHDGIDLAGPKGSPAYAAQGGTVVFAGWGGDYGNYVKIDHGGGLWTGYGHLDTVSVAKGDAVAAGRQIGTVGSTGRSSGPHLHFQVSIGGEYQNPRPYIM